MAVKNINHETLYQLFDAADKSIFTKKGRFLFRKAKDRETVLTIVAGKLETLKRATAGSIVIRNINLGGSAETYIIDSEKFKDRYEDLGVLRHVIDGVAWYEAKAKGLIEAFQYLDPDPIQFKASWGENMVCYCEDYIGRPVGGDPHDIYRIEHDTFVQTYGESNGE